MTPEIEKRIKLVQAGKVPAGYKLSKVGVIPNEWSLTYLKDVAIHVTEKNKDNAISLTLTNSATKGVIKQTEYFDKQISNKENTDGYFVVQNGDYIYNPRISESAPCGPINRSHLGESGIASPLYTVFRMNSDIHNECYIEMFLKSPFWHRYMCGVANYGARHDRMNITNDDLFSMPLPVPPKREQEKIAEILAAQDRVIELKEKLIEEKKIIKNYIVRLYFFSEECSSILGNNCIEKSTWKKTTLGNVCSFLDSLRKPIKESERKRGPYPYYGASGVIDFVEDYIFDGDYILLGEDGANIVSRSTPLAFKVSGKAWINNHAHVLSPKEGNDIDFWVNYLESLNYEKYNTGTAQPKLNQDVIEKIEVFQPSLPEQQAIAKVLSAADEEISLLQKDLEQEKLKKKSLMQLLLTGLVRVSA